MTVCRFHLQGRCRYGDRCWNEHVDPSSAAQRRDDYTWVSPSVASSRNYPQNQSPRGNYSNQYREPGPRYNYGNDYSWSSSPPRNQHSDRYGSSNVSGSYYDNRSSESYERSKSPKQNTYFQSNPQNQSSRGNYSNQYREPGPRYNYGNDYSWSSSPPRNQNSDRYGSSNVPSGYYDNSSTESYERSKSPKQNTYFQPKSPNRYEVLSQVNDKGNSDRESNLISAVKNDITEWEESHIWPFSCHSHFKDVGACLSGFVDLSPEELRYSAYEAEKSGSFALYTGVVADAMNEVKKKWDVLKSPTTDVLHSIKSYQGTPDFCAENLKKLIGETVTAGSFGGQMNNEIFIQDNSGPSSGSFSFKLAHFDSSPSVGSPTSAFKSLLPTANKVESSFPAFGASSSSGFGSSSTSVFAPSSSSSISSGFGLSKEKQGGSTKASVSSEIKSSAYTLLENLTESERAQFSSQTFTLGKIPSRPPPVELCF